MTIKTYGSLFAGVGGIDLGLDSVGLDCKFQVEIEENCQQTLSYHWPNVPKFYDVKEVSGYDLPPVDLITFGSPCQDLSVAGKRAGLDGDRSGLFFEAVRIIKEMREKTNGQYPKWSLWENVTGALSSNGGADFGQVLWEMDEAGACFSEWAILDAQYFGVPQRRRRIYLLSCFDPATATRCPDKILAVKESSSGNSEKSLKQKKQTSREITERLRRVGERGDALSSGIEETIEGYPTLFDGTRVNDVRVYEEGLAPCLTSRMGTGGNTVPMIVESNNEVIGFSHTQGLDPQASDKAWPTLRREGNGHAVKTFQYVRRLTPIECERLMGWPDNHTLFRVDGKENSDTTRYKMCGNGVVSYVIQWIANQIKDI